MYDIMTLLSFKIKKNNINAGNPKLRMPFNIWRCRPSMHVCVYV